MNKDSLYYPFKMSMITSFLGNRVSKQLHYSLNHPIESQARLLRQSVDYLKSTCIFKELNLDQVNMQGTNNDLFESFRSHVPLLTPNQYQRHVKIAINSQTHLFPSNDPVIVAATTSGTSGPPKIFPITKKSINYVKEAMKTVYGLPIKYSGINALIKKTFLLRPAPTFSTLDDLVDLSTSYESVNCPPGKKLNKIPIGYMTAIVGSYPEPSKKFLPMVSEISIFPSEFDHIMNYFSATTLKHRKNIFSMLGITTLLKIMFENILYDKDRVLKALNVLNNQKALLSLLERKFNSDQIEQLYRNKDELARTLENLYESYRGKKELTHFTDIDPQLEELISQETLVNVYPYLRALVHTGVPFDRSTRAYFIRILGKKVLNLEQLGGTDSVIGYQLASKQNRYWVLDKHLSPVLDYSVLEFLSLEDIYDSIGSEDTTFGIEDTSLVKAFKLCSKKTKYIWELRPNHQYLALSTIPFWSLVRYTAGDVITTTSDKVGDDLYQFKFEKRIEGGFNFFGSKATDSELTYALYKAAKDTCVDFVHFTITPELSDVTTKAQIKIFIEFVKPPDPINLGELNDKFKKFLSESNRLFAHHQDRFDILIEVVKPSGFRQWITKKGTRIPGHSKIPVITKESDTLAEFLIER